MLELNWPLGADTPCTRFFHPRVYTHTLLSTWQWIALPSRSLCQPYLSNLFPVQKLTIHSAETIIFLSSDFLWTPLYVSLVMEFYSTCIRISSQQPIIFLLGVQQVCLKLPRPYNVTPHLYTAYTNLCNRNGKILLMLIMLASRRISQVENVFFHYSEPQHMAE